MKMNIKPSPLGISLHAEIAQRLRQMILNNELRPGEKIDEPALCELFGVSRTPLREALKVLSNEGHISLAPNRGARVSVTTPQDVIELFPILGALEGLAGELACQKVTDLQIESIQLMHDEMIECYQSNNSSGYSELNHEIHQAIFRFAENEALEQLYNQISSRAHYIRFVAKREPEDWATSIKEHEKMIDALSKRDGEELNKTLKKHLDGKAKMVINFLTKNDPDK